MAGYLFKTIKDKKEESTFRDLIDIMQDMDLSKDELKEDMLEKIDIITDQGDGDFRHHNPIVFDKMDFYKFYTGVFNTSIAHPELTVYTCYFAELLNDVTTLANENEINVHGEKVYDTLVYLAI